MTDYRLSGKAQDDLIEIYLEGARRFGSEQAEKYHNELKTLFELIADNPYIAAERSEINPQVRVHPHGAHIIIYMIDNEASFILRIRHHKEDWKNEPV